MAALLECSNLSCGYAGHVVLRNASFQVAPGEVLAVLGINGSGKSTLLKAVTRSAPVLGGSISIDGSPIESLSYSESAKLVAFVPQDEHLAFGFRVREVVMMGRIAHSPGIFDTAEDEQVVDSAMGKADCLHLAKRAVMELSGGERQRVWIARALAQEAKLMLLDEPTSHLDVAHQLGLLRLIREMGEDGLGVLVAFHDLNHASRSTSRALVLHDGEIALDAPIEDVLASAQLDEIFKVRFERLSGPSGGIIFPAMNAE